MGLVHWHGQRTALPHLSRPANSHEKFSLHPWQPSDAVERETMHANASKRERKRESLHCADGLDQVKRGSTGQRNSMHIVCSVCLARESLFVVPSSQGRKPGKGKDGFWTRPKDYKNIPSVSRANSFTVHPPSSTFVTRAHAARPSLSSQASRR